MKKLCILLAVFAVLTLFSACKDKVADKEGDGAFTVDDGELYLDVPKETLGGECHILNAETPSPASAFTTEEVEGSSIGDAIYRRRTNTEARLSVQISEERASAESVYDMCVQSILADEDLYSAVSLPVSYAAALAANGYLYEISYLDEINTSKPWWNMFLSQTSSVGERIYYLFGDIQQDMYDAYSVVCVNMETAENTDGIGDVYSLVQGGNWTVDQMLRMMRMTSYDADGNSVLDSHDSYGLTLSEEGSLSLFFGVGGKLCEKNQGYAVPRTEFFSERSINADKLRESLVDNRCTYYEASDEAQASAYKMFSSGRSLFYVTTLGDLYRLRETDWEVGIVPVPKENADMKDYASLLPAKSASVVCVPKTVRKASRSAVLLENLAAESYRSGGVADCYRNSVLEFRYIDSEQSRKSLDIILNSGVLDLGDIYNFGGVSDLAKRNMGQDYIGAMKQNKTKIENGMLDVVEKLEIVK